MALARLPPDVDWRPPPARLVDGSLLVALAVVVATGVVSLAATPAEWWVFAVHGVAGLALAGLLAWKLRRVLPKVGPGLRAGSASVGLSVLLTVVALAALATGLAWSSGVGTDLRFRGWTLLNLHVGLALLVVPLLVVHLYRRFHLPTSQDWEGRRSTLQYAGLVLGGALAWRASKALGARTGDPRFTGSRAEGGEGNDFSVTSWVLDDPDPVDPEAWRLNVVGRVEGDLELDYADLPTPGERTGDGRSPVEARSERAVLDCTSGWYADREWSGVRVGELLDVAGVDDDAAWVTFHSVTGYRFGFPVEEAREVLLATHVGGDELTHGHGFPLRVVAPGRRGFQWVKWVTAVEVRATRDFGQWVAIFVSGLE